MVTKQEKQKLLLNIKDKDERVAISSIIDRANKSELSSKITATSFLDLNIKTIAVSMLNRMKVNYYVYLPNKYSEKSIIFFIPEYMENLDINFEDYVSCIKIISNNDKLMHKDFMGAIYSLGIKNECIGDIFISKGVCYVYVIKSMEKYIMDNLIEVGRNSVQKIAISIKSKEALELKVDYIEKEYVIPSMRIDALLSEVYGLGRKESKEKIMSGDLYINARECTDPSFEFKEGDIVSFRRCGKLKVGQNLRKTKSGNTYIKIYKYK